MKKPRFKSGAGKMPDGSTAYLLAGVRRIRAPRTKWGASRAALLCELVFLNFVSICGRAGFLPSSFLANPPILFSLLECPVFTGRS